MEHSMCWSEFVQDPNQIDKTRVCSSQDQHNFLKKKKKKKKKFFFFFSCLWLPKIFFLIKGNQYRKKRLETVYN